MDPLSRRIEELAALATDDRDDSGAVVDAELGGAVAALRAEVAALRGEVAALGRDVGGSLASVRSELEEVGDGLTGQVSAARGDSGSLGKRVGEVGGRVDALSDTLDGLVQAVSGLAGSLDERFAASRATSEGAVSEAVSEVLVEARTAVESRLAVLEDALDGLVERIESLARDGASTTTERLADLGRAVAGVETALGRTADQLADVVVARLSGQHDTRLAELEESVQEVLRLHVDQLRREVVEVLGRGAAETVATRAAVTSLAETSRSSLEGFAHTVDRDLKGLVAAVTQALAEGREEAQTELDDVAERLLSTVATLQSDLVSRSAADTARLEALRGQIATALADVRADVVTEVAELRPRIEELSVAAAATTEGFATLRADLADTVEALRDRVITATGDAVDDTRTLVTGLGTEVTVLREDVASSTAGLSARVDETGRLAAELQTALERAVTTDLPDALAGQVRIEVGTASDALREDLRRTVTDEVDRVHAALPGATTQVVADARAAAEAVSADLRAQLQAQLSEIRAALAATVVSVSDARSGLDRGTDRLATAGDVLVTYLKERDALLEAERDRVLHELVQDLALSLTAKERASVVSALGTASARRRDARDAERFRSAVGRPELAPVEVPEPVEALAPEPAPDRPADELPALRLASPGDEGARTTGAAASTAPAPAETSSSAEESSSTPATGTAKRAPAKRGGTTTTGSKGAAAKATTKKTAATKATTKKATATKATAKSAATKATPTKATATRAPAPTATATSAPAPTSGATTASAAPEAPTTAGGRGSRSTPIGAALAGSERGAPAPSTRSPGARARVDAMPESRSPDTALDAVIDRGTAGRPARTSSAPSAATPPGTRAPATAPRTGSSAASSAGGQPPPDDQASWQRPASGREAADADERPADAEKERRFFRRKR